ncbi:MAG: hypothetical protein WC600_02315 [Desulfobaccales bacterium]
MAKWIRGIGLAAALLVFLPLSGRVSGEEQMSSILREIRQIEFNQINYDEPSRDYFGYIKGHIPILISAPHGAKHFRTKEARWKEEDAYTASMAIKLGELTGAHVMYVKNRAGEDPNNDVQTRYKDRLKQVVEQNHIKFVLDLHGAGKSQPFKVDVGTLSNDTQKSSCPTFKGTIAEAFQGYEPQIFNQRFSARGSGTVTCYARKTLGVESAQVEINAKCRIVESKTSSFKADGPAVLDLVGRLEKLILAINRQIERSRTEALLKSPF